MTKKDLTRDEADKYLALAIMDSNTHAFTVVHGTILVAYNDRYEDFVFLASDTIGKSGNYHCLHTRFEHGVLLTKSSLVIPRKELAGLVRYYHRDHSSSLWICPELKESFDQDSIGLKSLTFLV
jgi:chloramphenicol O-acetyltransferase